MASKGRATTPKVGVLFVHTATLPPLGADTWVHAQIIRDLDRAAHDVHAACVTRRDGRTTPTYDVLRDIPDLELLPVDLGPELAGPSSARAKLGALVAMVPALGSLVRMARYVRRHDISIIHTSDRPRDAFACVLLARLTGATCIIHCHVGYGEWMSSLLTGSLRRADALIAISQFVAGTLAPLGREDASSTYVVLNAIEPGAWQSRLGRSATRHELRLDDAAPVVITVCRLMPWKGPDELIRAVATVRDAVPDVRLLVVGEEMTPGGGYRQELEGLVAELGVDEHVTFTGRRSDVPRLMAAADVFAMASVEEPFGLVYLEAMATGLPVVAVDSGGTPEVVEHARSGLLSRPGDTQGLAESMLRLIRAPEERRRMGEYGRRAVDERFTTERMARDVADVYRSVTGRAARRVGAVRGNGKERDMQVLSADDVEQVHQAIVEDGYAVIRQVVSKDRLQELGQSLDGEYARMKAAHELFDGGGSLSGHLNCFPGEQSRFVYEEILDHHIGEVARAIDPVKAEMIRPTLNYNLPNSVAQFYHMDGLYTDPFLICNIAVVDTDLNNGALDVLPGTHRRFYKFWRYAVERKYRLSTRVCLEQGDVVLRMSTLWHRGMPNKSPNARPMMSITFGENVARESDPFMMNGGKVEFYPNWYSTDRVGQLREKMFVSVPFTDSAYRFARSLVSNKGYSSW